MTLARNVTHVVESEEQERSFDTVRVKYINLDSVKFVVYTKLECIQVKDGPK